MQQLNKDELPSVTRPYDPRNPNNIQLHDWVFFKGKIGQVSEIACDKPNLLQYWVAWQGETVLALISANLLQKLDTPVGINSDSNYQFIRFHNLKIDDRLQQRVKLNQSVIDEYSVAYSENQLLPPITVWNCTDDDLFYLVDGFHRYEAAKIAGLIELPFIEKIGTFKSAILFTVSVNSEHGLRRSNDDKQKAVLTLLHDEEWSQWSNRQIARQCGVSHQFVNNIRHIFSDNGNLTGNKRSSTSEENKRKYRKEGIEYSMDITNLSSDSDLDDSEVSENVTEKLDEDLANDTKLNKKPRLINPLSVGEMVKVKDNHYFGGKEGVVVQIPNFHSVMVAFDDNQRELVNLSDLNPPLTPKQPQGCKPCTPTKKEIILKEGLNYFARTQGGNRWYVEIEEDTYAKLTDLKHKLGKITLNCVISYLLSELF